MASKVLELLEQAAPRATAISPRPAGAFDCALAEFGCSGWVKTQFTVLKLADGTPVGLCPRREQHRQIANGDPEAATVVGRLAGLFRLANPTYVVGSKARTRPMKVAKA